MPGASRQHLLRLHPQHRIVRHGLYFPLTQPITTMTPTATECLIKSSSRAISKGTTWTPSKTSILTLNSSTPPSTTSRPTTPTTMDYRFRNSSRQSFPKMTPSPTRNQAITHNRTCDCQWICLHCGPIFIARNFITRTKNRIRGSIVAVIFQLVLPWSELHALFWFCLLEQFVQLALLNALSGPVLYSQEVVYYQFALQFSEQFTTSLPLFTLLRFLLLPVRTVDNCLPSAERG